MCYYQSYLFVLVFFRCMDWAWFWIVGRSPGVLCTFRAGVYLLVYYNSFGVILNTLHLLPGHLSRGLGFLFSQQQIEYSYTGIESVISSPNRTL